MHALVVKSKESEMLSESKAVSAARSLALFLTTVLLAGVAAAQTSIPPEQTTARVALVQPANSMVGPLTSADEIKSGSTLPGEVAEASVVSDAAKTQPATAPIQPQPTATPVPPCNRNIAADVVALPQAIMLNRLGASIPDGLVFALRGDTLGSGSSIRLRDDKRPRPIALRANVGDCITIKFTNAIPAKSFSPTKVAGASTGTTEVSLHVQGMQWLTGFSDDGSFVGTNNSSLASASTAPSPQPSPMPPQTQVYHLYAKEEGTFLLYTMGDTSTQGLQLERGLFGALNVEPQGAEWYRSQVTHEDLSLATKKDGSGHPK